MRVREGTVSVLVPKKLDLKFNDIVLHVSVRETFVHEKLDVGYRARHLAVCLVPCYAGCGAC